MKILLISNMYPSKQHPHYGPFVKNFKEQLENDGCFFKLAVIRGKETSKIGKIQQYILFFKEVITAIKKNEFDLIYVHYIGHSLLPLLLVKRYIRKPLVINAHGSDVFVNHKLGKYIQKLVTPIIKLSNLIVVPSQYFKHEVSQKFSIAPSEIFVSPSGGIDIDLFYPHNKTNYNDIFTIGYVSRIDEGKGWDVLLEGVSLLKNNRKFKVLIIGGGSQENLILEKINQLSLKNSVEYLGVKSHLELPKYFNMMDLFIFPSRLTESLGLVGLEAMACGVPVLGSNIGGIPSYVNDDNGKLLTPNNVSELREGILYFMDLNQVKFLQYKNNALKTSQAYNSKLVSQELLEKLETLRKNHNE